jgi:hypothetical protein
MLGDNKRTSSGQPGCGPKSGVVALLSRTRTHAKPLSTLLRREIYQLRGRLEQQPSFDARHRQGSALDVPLSNGGGRKAGRTDLSSILVAQLRHEPPKMGKDLDSSGGDESTLGMYIAVSSQRVPGIVSHRQRPSLPIGGRCR